MYNLIKKTTFLTNRLFLNIYDYNFWCPYVSQAINAAKFGVVGVIVYTDPKDINDGLADKNQTYPNSWYMPPSAVERGSYTEDFGDLLTPYYPAKSKYFSGYYLVLSC